MSGGRNLDIPNSVAKGRDLSRRHRKRLRSRHSRRTAGICDRKYNRAVGVNCCRAVDRDRSRRRSKMDVSHSNADLRPSRVQSDKRSSASFACDRRNHIRSAHFGRKCCGRCRTRCWRCGRECTRQYRRRTILNRERSTSRNDRNCAAVLRCQT